jgi:spore germination protein
MLSSNLEVNMETLKETFQNCSDVVFRQFTINDGTKALLLFIDGTVNSDEIHENALRALLFHYRENAFPSVERIISENIALSQIHTSRSMFEIVHGILDGNAVLIVDGQTEAIIINIRGGVRRGIEEPASETVIRGPREGFNENIRTNTALVRLKIKSTQLKMLHYKIGTQTKTSVIIAYIDGLIDPAVLEELKSRLAKIKIDGILESGYLEELIEDQPFSPFRQVQYTERPDTVAAQLLEGKFAIFVDGTPFVLIGPVTFWQMMQSSEDYYEHFLISSLIRMLRYVFLMIALYLPALYIALTTFYQDMIPTNLMFSVAAAREPIPFPAIIEAMIMEVSFEALREAGIRLPRIVGQAVSILGALVIGQAAVEAGIVSTPMVIVVSLTGIASFTIPHFNFAIAIRILRFPLMILASTFGAFGIIIGTTLLVLHLCHLRSFGVPYLSGLSPLKTNELKDIFIRIPWWKMVYRSTSYSDNNRKRMNQNDNRRSQSSGEIQ